MREGWNGLWLSPVQTPKVSNALNEDWLIGLKLMIRNGKASIMLEKHGFIKLISDKETHEILGVHILGKNSTELISEPAFAMQIDATVEEIATTVHAHPTLYESIYEAALMAFNTK